MKASILSIGSCALTLLSCSLVHSFPTPENFAKLVQHNALSGRTVSAEGLHENLLRMKEKRLFFDPMTTPVDGACSVGICHDCFSLISNSNWQTRFPATKLREWRPKRTMSWTQCAC